VVREALVLVWTLRLKKTCHGQGFDTWVSLLFINTRGLPLDLRVLFWWKGSTRKHTKEKGRGWHLYTSGVDHRLTNLCSNHETGL